MDNDFQKAAEWLEKYHRLTNYISAAMLYLKDNFLLDEELKPEHLKPRILGHWGTVPGINVVYGALNYIIKKYDQEALFVLGPGHGAPGVLSGLWVEKSLGEYYPNASLSKEGLGYLIKQFSWPGGFPSHTYPGLPGSIHEGGELGYSLGTAFGSAFNNPELLSVVLVGDGEAETGPLAASWQCNKFLNPKIDGAVLPILHLNGYRISGPTFFGTMSDEEIREYFFGLSYEPIFIDTKSSSNPYLSVIEGFEDAYHKIKHLREFWDEGEKTMWPVIILRSAKGWSGPKYCEGIKIEDHNNSHGIPLENVHKSTEQFQTLQEWLKSYQVSELLDDSGSPLPELFDHIPEGKFRLGANKHTNGGNVRTELLLPRIEDHAMRVEKRGIRLESRMLNLGQYLRDVFNLNNHNKNFKLFSPDETESNKLHDAFHATGRRYIWPVGENDNNYSFDGDILEILSEHVLQEMLTGYLITGRHGMFVSYEAFFGIVTNQVEQYVKFLEQSKPFHWRKPLSSMNLVSTSTAWRQEHNGFSHQNPSLINALLTKSSEFVNVYFPSDVNTLIATLDECFRSTNCVNLVIACKRPTPQWLTIEEARDHVHRGMGVWHWVESTHQDDIPDVVLASAGDYQTVETLAAIQMLNELIPEIRLRYVNINELTRMGLGDKNYSPDTDKEYMRYFTRDRDVLFNFHGYPEAIKQLTWGHELSNRMKIFGYNEKGTTTTPFDMQVQNKTSRYHIAIETIKSAYKWNKKVLERKNELITHFEVLLEKHHSYIREYGDDIPEVKNFEFKY